MKFKYLALCFVLTFFSIKNSAFSQDKTTSLWDKVSKPSSSLNRTSLQNSYPSQAAFYQVDINSLKTKLEESPKRGTLAARHSNVVIKFPNIDGVLESYRIEEASTMAPELQAQFPNTRSYSGKGIDDPTALIRFSISDEKGLSSMVLSTKKTVFIEPYSEDLSTYILYTRSSDEARSDFVCETEYIPADFSNFDLELYRNANDGTLRTFRLALACTGEYAQFHGGTVPNVVAAMNTTMTRVNGVFERDVAITMEIVANNTNVIYLNAGTDPYTNNNGGAMLGENQTACDANIGTGNYDIGHVFSTGGGGVAYLNSPCTGIKAGGVTGQAAPVGDTFDIDYVAHEMGHQYGGNHTQNNACNRSAVSVEPGSASTIMGYAGICAPNVQGNSDDYFHGENIKEMWANISAGNSTCGAQSGTGNTAPIATAGSNHIIPISTPFVLRGSATDVNGTGSLTYCWEQVDTAPATMPPVSTSTGGPAFRSLLPKVSPNRYMPDFATVLAGSTASTWEVVPSVSRTMDFSLTVRDNVSGGASSDSDSMRATTTAAAGPFIVTSQGTPVTWNAGGSELITWNVAGTTANGVNTANVNILMTTDAGATFTTLLANTPNDGSQTITVPNVVTSTARIIVEGAGNIFYNVNAADITIQTSSFTMNFGATTQDVCAPNNAVYTFTYNTYLGFSGTTNFTASGNPAGTTVSFSPTSATTNGTIVTVTINSITPAMVGTNVTTITGTSGPIVRNADITTNIFSSTFNTITLTSPINGAIGVTAPYVLQWNVEANASAYDVEIATDAAFTNIIETQSVAANTYTATNPIANTQYYWRVRPTNSCGIGSWSSAFNFTTSSTACTSYMSTHAPANIPDGSSGVGSYLNVTTPVEITDVNVTVNITHTWDSDLVIRLTSPLGTFIYLSWRNGADGDNYTNTYFDDDAATNIIAGTAPFTGSFQPEEALSAFNTEISTGVWELAVFDLATQDTGTLVDWTLEICGVDNCLSTTTWNGTAWSNGLPAINRNVILNGDYTTSPGSPSFEACTLTINPNRNLIISSGDYVRVQNDLSVGNNAIVDIAHEGSLVMVDDAGTVSNAGTMNVRKSTPVYVEYDYTYWSSPVQNQAITTVFAANPSSRIYYFDTTNFNDGNGDSYDDEADDWYQATGNLIPGEGVIAMGQGAFTTPLGNTPYPTYSQSVVFSGTVNTGVITVDVDQDNSLTDAFENQNLLGNPYPSAIDPELFIQANSTALEGTLYFWTHRTAIVDGLPGVDGYNFTNDDYNSYNLSGMVASGAGQATPSNFKIASGQGFFANVSDPSIDVVFNNSMRVNSENDNFYRTEESSEKNRIWLNLETEGQVFRQMLLAFFDHTTAGYDKLYDGKLLENGNNYSFYSLIDNEAYSIQAREAFDVNQVVRLGIEATQPTVMTISISQMEGIFNDSETSVYLKDNLLNSIHDLKASDYSFNINEAGIYNNRFELIFNDESLSTIDEEEVINDLIVYESNNTVYIKTSNNSPITSVVVHDILGRLLIDYRPNLSLVELNGTRFKQGTILIIQVEVDNEKKSIKKFIKR
ncbi:reprolysin-like metallopeptidase [Lacinutrix iliipiscaria]|uniref:Reprolysin-like metallopeptidase n=1 Tax=Lacinutrix iliipiscaria TaxID=1230532 RepID=A0ABW5WMD2_9FLAO